MKFYSCENYFYLSKESNFVSYFTLGQPWCIRMFYSWFDIYDAGLGEGGKEIFKLYKSDL